MFKKIGRRLFFGFLLIYVAMLLVTGAELLVRRSTIGDYEHIEATVNRLNDIVAEIAQLTADLDTQSNAFSTAEAAWRQEVNRINAEVEAKYKIAMRLAGDDSTAVRLLQVASDQSARWVREGLEATTTGLGNHSPASVEKLRRPTEIYQTHRQLGHHLRVRRQNLLNRIRTRATTTDHFILIVLFSSMLLTAVLAVRVPQAIGGQIQVLVRMTKELEAGCYVPGTRPHPEDEFGDLGRAFDRMAQTLKEKESQLQQSLSTLENLNKNLETIVEERTSQLRAAQEELIKKEKLSMLGTLAGSIGHELRNPLSVMATSVYFLRKTLPNLDGKTLRHLDMVSHQISAANRIITNLLDFTRTKEPTCEPTDLNQLVHEAANLSSIPRAVHLKLNLSDEPLPVLADPTQISQVLLNLISNAIQAMPRGGDLDIGVSRSNGVIQVVVADTGGGIAEEHRGKVFQPLFTTKQKGIGLGLAVSKKIVEANQGQIDFQSRQGQGTQFRLRFPALKPEGGNNGTK
jgi:signal transduction histidine kinase